MYRISLGEEKLLIQEKQLSDITKELLEKLVKRLFVENLKKKTVRNIR